MKEVLVMTDTNDMTKDWAWEKITSWVENGDIEYAEIIDVINTWYK